jgi:hypothetical protein
MRGTFIPYKLIGDVFTVCVFDFTPYSKMKRMDYFESIAIQISYDLLLEWL